MRILAGVLLSLLALTLRAAPLPTSTEFLYGMPISVSGDEFGVECHDPQGRLMVREGDTWYYAIADPGPSGYHHGEPGIDRPDSVYLREDPVIAARRREFHSHASQIVPVSGEVRLTVVPVWMMADTWPHPDLDRIWHQEILGDTVEMQSGDLHALIFEQGLEPFVDAAGYEIGGSVADWWSWASEGVCSLVPDRERHAWADNDSLPGLVLDPVTHHPLVLDGTPSNTAFWNCLDQAGFDTRLDPLRPILFVTLNPMRDGSSLFEGCAFVPLVQERLAPATPGLIAHELCHAVLQLPDTYTTVNGTRFRTRYQMMNYGCYGVSLPDLDRNDRGYPSDLCAPFKHLLGWGEVETVFPGHTLDFRQHPRRMYRLPNPADGAEALYFRSWDPEVGFMQHYSPTGGYTLVEHALRVGASHEFVDKPRPWIYQSTDSLDTWPQPGHDTPGLEHWQDGSWFPCNTVFPDSTGLGRVILEPRDPGGLHLALLETPCQHEIARTPGEQQISLVNLGRAVQGYRILFNGHEILGTDTVHTGEVLGFTVPPSAWGWPGLGDRLDFPLVFSSGGDTITVARFQPVVGLDPAGLEIPLPEGAEVVRSSGRFLAIAEGNSLQVYDNGEFHAQVPLPGQVEEAYPLDDRLIVEGDSWCTLVDLPAGTDAPGWPREYTDPVECSLVAELPQFGPCLVVATGGMLCCTPLDQPQGGCALELELPVEIRPVLALAFAGGDPADSSSAPGARFCLVGGTPANRMCVIQANGQVVYTGTAGEDGRFGQPLGADLLGNGYYEFVVPSIRNRDGESWNHLEVCSYSAASGEFGGGEIPLSPHRIATASGSEFLVPIRSEDWPPRTTLLTSLPEPYHDSLTAMVHLDLPSAEPRIHWITNLENRRRWLLVCDRNNDGQDDLLRMDRGLGLFYLMGTGGMDFEPVGSADGLVHRCLNTRIEPVFITVDGTVLAGFPEPGRLRFHLAGLPALPEWANARGRGNSHFQPNPDWSLVTHLGAPRLGISWQQERLHLQVLPLDYGQHCSRLRIEASRDRIIWQTLEELDWDGRSLLEWSSREQLLQPGGFFRCVAEIADADGSVFWTHDPLAGP